MLNPKLILAIVCCLLLACNENNKLLFKGNSLSPNWTVNTSEGNAVALENGELKISAARNSHALVRQPLNIDHFRVSGEIKSAGGESWAPAICLYWNKKNWVQLLMADKKGIMAVEMTNGNMQSYKLSSYQHNEYNSEKISDLWEYDEDKGNLELKPVNIDSRAWTYLGIELQDGQILYLSGKDGINWTIKRLGYRLGDLSAAPQTLILGKGYSDSKLQAEFMSNDFDEKGDPGISYMRNVKLETGLDEKNGRKNLQVINYGEDILGKQELDSDSDPSMESVSRYFPAIKYQREAIGVKDHAYEFSVFGDGTLQCKDTITYFVVNEKRFGQNPDFPKKRLHLGYLPMVISDWSHDGIQYEQTQFGWSKNMSTDNDLYGFVSLKIKNTRNTDKNVQITYHGTPLKPWDIRLKGGEEQTLYISIPYLTPENTQVINREKYDEVFTESVNEWEKLLNSGMKIVVPEKKVNDAYRAWLAYNFLNVDKTNNRYEMRDGNHFYEELYGFTACMSIQGFDWMGFGSDAEKYLESLLTIIDKDGLFTINYGLPDQGAILIAMAEHYKMTDDKNWLKRMSPTIIKLCKWVVKKRAEEKLKQDPDGALYGLIKFRPYCDMWNQTEYFYGSDITVTAGMEAAADVFRSIGLDKDAEWIAAEAADYRKCIMRSVAKSVILHDGMKKLPMFPETHQLLRAANYNAYDYYGLVAGTLLEVNALEPESEYAMMIVDLLEKKGGLLLGVCRFWGGIDHAYTYGYWMNCMDRNEVKKSILGFYTSMAYGMTRDTYSAVEITFIEEGKNFYTLPHSYSNTQQLKLLRNMLLREKGDDLLIAQATPRPWLEDGKTISVKDAPTRFGDVNYQIDSKIASGKILVQLTPPIKKQVNNTVIHLRHPESKPIKGVIMKGKGKYTFSKDQITLSGLVDTVSLEVSY